MLDLFRKEEINALKIRIKELEDENRKLRLRVGKKDEKTKQTAAAGQEVNRELNEAKQQVMSLENEIVKLRKETKGELNFRFSESFSKNRLEDILFLLGTMQSRTAALITIYLAKDDTLANMPSEIATHIDSSQRALIEKIDSHTGRAIFFDAEKVIKLVILPVFPILLSKYSLERSFDMEPLKNSLKSDKILVINAHAGETFIGIMEDNSFTEHDVIRSSVMGKHSKGGWSQKRFQNLVEEDIKHHADKVRAVLDPLIRKHRDIQYIIAGGDGKLIRMILAGYDHPIIMKSMDTVSTRNAEQVLREVMSVRVYGI
ncbi:MAG: Vms1/Ankzf1 family peptidyl-tRNA hydrolase [Candidatus Methanoperedens sp.]|nr:Vms1/Ankzf1 family peptidyl-tRNA hydrolase [Candidatus Methanoperedens sp.]